MIHRFILRTIAVIMFVTVTAFIATGQTGELRGHVFMQQADGQKAAIADAIIDVFRTDLTAKYNTKTNKKGEYVFAGLPLIGTFTVAASAASAQPTFIPGVKVGRGSDVDLVVTPGNGKRLTLEDIKNAGGTSTAPPSSSESAADRAKREEMLKKNAEIEEKNKKITESNEVVARSFKAGNEALKIKNYDEAIKQYDTGLQADPEQPALLTNKAIAYKARGVDRFNAAVTATDEATKTSSMEGAKSDFRIASEAASKAVDLVKAQTPPTDPTGLAQFNVNKLAALTTRVDAMRFFVTKVDSSKADDALAAFKDYIGAETDPAKKQRAQLDAAQMLLDAGAVDKAFSEFQAIITAEPNNVDANLGAGLSLFASGDKAKYQDAANYLQHFVDVAPDTHKFKADAKMILEELKKAENVVPEKTTTPTRRKRP
ncbi:MAG: carboxypeptidase regulatory-like domain-containing protein [Pyrinomonadaceae bacterium]